MNLSRLNHIHLYAIGGFVAILLGVALYFLTIKPVMESNAALQQSITTTEGTTVTIDNKPMKWNEYDKAQDVLASARLRKDQKAAELRALESRKQLPPGRRLIVGTTQPELITTSLPLWLSLPRNVVNILERYAQQTARRHGVKVTTNFNAPATSPALASIPKTPLTWTIGPMSVRGPFPRVMAWVRDWNAAPLLVAVDGLKLSLAGRKGEVAGTATLTAYVFPDGPGAVPYAVPGGAGAAGGGGDMMGGMMGGGMMGGGMGADMGMMDPAMGGMGGMDSGGGGGNGP